MVRPHPNVLGEDEEGNDIVSNGSTQYFFDEFTKKFKSASSPIEIKKIKHSAKNQLNDVVEITFSVKSKPNVLLMSRLLLNPDDNKFSTADQGYHRNFKVANDPKKLASLASARAAVNLTIAAVFYNPLLGEKNYEETSQLLHSLVLYG